MANSRRNSLQSRRKDPINSEIRKKLGITQAQLASILGVSRPYITLAESKKRNLDSRSNLLLTNIYFQFHELETGKQVAYRTLEMKLFLNDEYKKKLPEMKALELDRRNKIKQLKKEMETMKEAARDAEHAIIVFTTVIQHFIDSDKKDNKTVMRITGMQLLKAQAYGRLLTCWEPEQAKLQARIEAIAGEAKALRRYRVKVMREHNPFKIKKTVAS
jgi:transcriptional regulator with XRE-family HTH domain